MVFYKKLTKIQQQISSYDLKGLKKWHEEIGTIFIVKIGTIKNARTTIENYGQLGMAII